MLIVHRVHKATKGKRKGQEVMVECMVKEGRKIVGGLALCNPRDTFDLHEGMKRSFKRAMHGMKDRPDRDHTDPIVTNGASQTIEDCGFPVPVNKTKVMGAMALVSKACKLEQKFLDV